MANKTAEILPRHELSAIDIDRLEGRLYDYNRQATGQDDGRKLAFVAVDARGAQIGAIAGYSWARMAEIKQLWVDEDYRGLGIGRRLLEAAIGEAVRRYIEDAHDQRSRLGEELCEREPLEIEGRVVARDDAEHGASNAQHAFGEQRGAVDIGDDKRDRRPIGQRAPPLPLPARSPGIGA